MPSYNHTREDSNLYPCNKCLKEMTEEQRQDAFLCQVEDLCTKFGFVLKSGYERRQWTVSPIPKEESHA